MPAEILPPYRVLAGHEAGITDVCCLPDSMVCISASLDHTLRAWDLETGQCLRVFAGHAGPVRALSMTKHGIFFFSGAEDETLKMWHFDRGEVVHTFAGHKGPVNADKYPPCPSRRQHPWDYF